MIGPKKLNTIRQELERALAATAADPIRWLEARIAAPQRQGAPVSGESEVLRSLRRFLQATEGRKRRKQRVGTKK